MDSKAKVQTCAGCKWWNFEHWYCWVVWNKIDDNKALKDVQAKTMISYAKDYSDEPNNCPYHEVKDAKM